MVAVEASMVCDCDMFFVVCFAANRVQLIRIFVNFFFLGDGVTAAAIVVVVSSSLFACL